MSVAAKYDLAGTLVKVMTDPAQAILELHALAMELSEKVEAAEKATTETSGEKVNALELRYGKDEDGRSAAESMLREDDGPFDTIINYIDEDPGRTFHVLGAVLDLLVKYLRNECAFFTMALTPPTAKISQKGEFKADFNEVRELIRNVAGMAEATGWDPSTCQILTTDSAGKYRSILPGYRGTKSTGDDGPVTGRYAKVYSLKWVIDGEEIDEFTIPEIVRLLWHGADRIGKNAKNLTDLLDELTDWTNPAFQVETFIVNGHNVTVCRTTSDD